MPQPLQGLWSVVLAAALLPAYAVAQPEDRPGEDPYPRLSFGGLAYIDYAYAIEEPDAEGDAFNTFDYRRAYLTANFAISPRFDGRFRLEAQGRSTTTQGRPAPFVKDLYLRWRDVFGEGHHLRAGVQSPPLFAFAEGVWGYRSLAQTLQDRVRVSDSREFGLRADGPLAGPARYALMVGNGNGLRPEDEFEYGKHFYGQVTAATEEGFRAALGFDVQAFEADGEPRSGEFKPHGFVGYEAGALTVGTEAFYLYTTFEPEGLTPTSGFGVSGFATFEATERVTLVGRYDYVEADAGRVDTDEHYVLGAVAVALHSSVEIMPNFVAVLPEGAPDAVTARVTLSFSF